MDGFPPNTSAFGQIQNTPNTSQPPTSSLTGFAPNIPTTNPKESTNRSWTASSSRGARGNMNGRGGRGNSVRGATPSSRGKAFGNRSAVFNSAGPVDNSEDNARESEGIQHFSSGNQFDTFQSMQQNSTNASNTFQQSQPSFQPDQLSGTTLKVFHSDFPSSTVSTIQSNDIAPKVSQSTSSLPTKKDIDQERKQRFENLPKQNRFFEMRAEREMIRAKYVREGVLPDPDKPTDLAEAKVFTGTCMEMCPEFEREEREFQNEGDLLEMFPGTNRIDPNLAVKIYRRPAAGRELPLPEDVRPPEILRKTLDYLLYNLLPSDPKSTTFTSVQPFMWNRTRAIRQDFIVQGDGGVLAIECHERIARYHILCLHWRGGVGAEGWSEQQELEQLRKTIRSLTEFYEDMRRRKGIICPNEAEFRSYNLLLHMQDPETLREAEGLPESILGTSCIQVALKLRAYAQRSNNVVRRGRPLNTEATMNFWTRFFSELRRNPQVTYLLACLAENAFSLIRAGALKAMGKTYNAQHAPLPLDYLKRSLGLDTEEEARTFAIELGAEEAFDHGGSLVGLRLGKVNDDKPLPNAPFSNSVVEVRRGSHTVQDIVDGRASGAAPLLVVGGSFSQKNISAPAISTAITPRPNTIPQPGVFGALSSSSFAQSSQLGPRETAKTLSATATAFVPSKTVISANIPEGSQSLLPRTTASTTPSGFIAATKDLTSAQKPASQSTLAFESPSTTKLSPTKYPAMPPTSPASPIPFGTFNKPAPMSNPTIPKLVPQQDPFKRESNKAPDQSPLPMVSKVKPSEISSIHKIELPKNSAALTTVKSERVKDLPVAKAPSPTTPAKTAAVPVPKRTIHSVVDGLARRMIKEMISKKRFSICEQACLREARIRQLAARFRLIDEYVCDFYSQMLDEISSDVLATIASEVVAKEKYSRSLSLGHWSRWKNALERAQERNGQNARLKELRNRIREGKSRNNVQLGLSKASTIARPSRRNVLVEMDDNMLQNKLNEAHLNREDVWMAATFFYSIVHHFERLLVPDIDVYTVGVQLSISRNGQESSASSQWLRTKLSIENQPHAEIALRSDVYIHMMDLHRCDPEDVKNERNLGLVLFELNENVTNSQSNGQGWKEEYDRLRNLTESNLVKNSKYFPKLMIIYWGEGTTTGRDGEAEDEMRKTIVKRMGLGAMDAVRHAWSQVGVWNAASAGISPQRGFEGILQSLTAPIEYSVDHRSITLEDVATVCSNAWRSSLDRIQASINRAAQVEHNLNPNQDDSQLCLVKFASLAFEISTLLTQKVISNIVSVSEMVLDENVYEEDETIPNPSLDDIERGPMMKTAYCLAMRQISLVRAKAERSNKDEATILLVFTWLKEQKRSSNTFPWLEYFIKLLYIHVEDLQSSWIETTLTNLEEIEKFVEASTSIFQEASIEVETKLRELFTLQPAQSTYHNKRRNETDSFPSHDPIEGDEDEDLRPMSKVRKMDDSQTTQINSKVRNPKVVERNKITREAIPAPLNSLKTLIASANKLLEERPEDN